MTRCWLVALAAVVSSGCMSISALVTIRPDGSGTVAQTLLMNTKATAQFGQMASALAKQHGQPGADKIPPNVGELMDSDVFSEGMLQAMASQMGEGVRLVSSEKLKEGPMQGVRAMYAFDDVTRIRLSQGGPGGGQAAKGEVSFGFEKLANGNAVLKIRVPALLPDQAFKMPAHAGPNVDPEAAKAMMAMMKPMLEGMRIEMALALDGRLVKSNIPFGSGDRLTLISLNMDEMMASPDFMKNITPPATLEEGKRRLQNMSGLKMVLEPEIVIEYASR